MLPPENEPVYVNDLLIGWCVDADGRIYDLVLLDQRRVLAGADPCVSLWSQCTQTAGACIAGWNEIACASLILELLRAEFVSNYERNSARWEFNNVDWRNAPDDSDSDPE